MNRADVETLGAARIALGLTVLELWVDYVSLGGNLPPLDLEALLRDGETMDDHNFDLIVQALNEHFIERHANHPLPYAEDLSPPAPDGAG